MTATSEDGFKTMLDEVLQERANPAEPAGLAERVMARVSAEAAMGPVTVQGGMFETTQRVAAGRSARSTGFAVLAHVAALLAIAAAVRSGVRLAAPVKLATIVEMPVAPPVAPVRDRAMGGGGGQKGVSPATKGTPPKFAEVQIVPPMTPPVLEPKIAVEPTLEVQRDVKMESSLPQIGVAYSPLVGMSMGNGSGTGLGSGHGNGLGDGSGGNTGGGPKRIGGGVSAPVLVFQVEPEFSEEARKAKMAGNVLVNLWVDAQGKPSHVRVLKGVGMGLDEKALAAVKQYRFRPAIEGGKPVLVEMNVEVIFQIF